MFFMDFSLIGLTATVILSINILKSKSHLTQLTPSVLILGGQKWSFTDLPCWLLVQ